MSKEIIDDIIKMEWEMFQKVNEGGPRASCQDDPETFDGMRRGQFMAWSEAALKSYQEDLLNAFFIGRNLVKEKYINMMKYTNPEEYKNLESMITLPSEQGLEDAAYIAKEMVRQTIPLHEKYPFVSGAGRPLYSTEDYKGFTSIETYQIGELLTYSDKTLRLLREHLDALNADGRSLAEEILTNSVRHYGFSSLEQAEELTRKNAQGQFGCSDCSDCADCCDGDCDCCG